MRRRLVADIVAKVENRATQKISRKSISGPHCCCLACKRHYEGPWSILAKAIWSLTSPRVRRISGSKNFSFVPPKRLFQQYLPTGSQPSYSTYLVGVSLRSSASALWASSHFGHSSVRKSGPAKLGSTLTSIMRISHLGQRDCSIMRGE